MKINNTKLNNYIRDKKCPMCGGNNFTTTGDLVTLSKIENDNSISPAYENMIPLVAITCENCSNTIFVNALLAKVAD